MTRNYGLLSVILLVAACSSPQVAVPDACPLPSGTDSFVPDCYWRTHTPLEFLDMLEENPGKIMTVLEVPPEWIQREHVAELMEVIDSGVPSASVVAAISSYLPFNQTSTIGNEALFLIEGYRQMHYPPQLCSLYYFRPNKTEIRLWWQQSRGVMPLTESDAVSLLQAHYPRLREYSYPGQSLRTIRTEKADDGYYIAFVQEGSGVPVIDAECFVVYSNRTIVKTSNYNRSYELFIPSDFSARRCG